jgi:hypothetical protein
VCQAGGAVEGIAFLARSHWLTTLIHTPKPSLLIPSHTKPLAPFTLAFHPPSPAPAPISLPSSFQAGGAEAAALSPSRPPHPPPRLAALKRQREERMGEGKLAALREERAQFEAFAAQERARLKSQVP